ncbi:TadE/TadG family type IV pilus assembly protein [Bremerella sp.]|uniref:TadE/TadG family type IV pilus assembly protein n=1 Tax=Bremerella sp. TaxID=2795602 RepID=UPI003919954C
MKSIRNSQAKGLAATELAICLPLLFVTTMFCVQLAQAYHIKAVANQAAWRAIRYASTTRFDEDEFEQWEADVKAQAVEELSQLTAFDPEGLTLNLETTLINDRVEIEMEMHLVIDSPLLLMPGDFEIQRNMRIRQYR